MPLPYFVQRPARNCGYETCVRFIRGFQLQAGVGESS